MQKSLPQSLGKDISSFGAGYVGLENEIQRVIA